MSQPLSQPTADGATATDLRAAIDAALAAGHAGRARALLGRLWAAAPTPATAPFVVSRFDRLRGQVPLVPCRLAVLRSFTVEPLVPLVKAQALVGGIDLEARLGDFDTVTQEVIDPASWVYGFAPTAIVIATQARDVAPLLWRDFADAAPADVDDEVARVARHYRHLVATLRSRTDAHVIVHNWQVPPAPALGLLDGRTGGGQVEAIRRVNGALAEVARESRNVYALDYDALIARHGAARWEDPRKWATVRLPVAADNLVHVAREWLRFLHPIAGRVCKCLVTDLDNTLWGGVIGEDGMDGIKLDDSAAGAPFRAVQRAILDLHRRGVILAIASKNNPDDARQAIERHTGMILRPDHFAVVRANWDDKATSLRAIAAELNIGIDSLAFIDDNPVERQWVAEQVPEVTVIDLPADPLGYADALRTAPVFERLTLTDEDRGRGRMYAEQRLRAELSAGAGSLEDFYRSLDMRAEIAPVSPATLPRVAQLTQKTNQFNLTTRRYTEAQVAELAADPACRVWTLKVVDRMGDNGLVGVAITRLSGDRCEVDTLLLSCRVIGRTVETAFLAHVAADARARGARVLAGWFVPTAKNAPAKSFYADHGFTAAREQDGATLWERDLTAGPGPDCPPWVALTVA
ncbi:MAG: HAD-IIIC family phosphatase [Phycisphaerae bacterium]